MNTALTELSQTMLPAVDRQLRCIVVQSVFDDYPGLEEMLSYHLGWTGEGAGVEAQGKRIRSVLVLLPAGAYGRDWQDALPAAAAVELIHNFSLIHDDIEDRSAYRRGRKTVWEKWGQALAINAGDAMFTLAYQALLGLSDTSGPEVLAQALAVFNRACLQLTGGQHLDISYENEDDLPLNAYWNMVGGKTAALLSACTRLGGLIGGASGRQADALAEFGRNLGLAFQVQDDWLGIWGNAVLTGKSTESDLLARKKTLPVLFALERGGEFSQRWSGKQIQAADLPGLTQLLEREGAKAYAEQKVSEFTGRSLQSLDAAGCAEPAYSALKNLATGLIGRKS